MSRKFSCGSCRAPLEVGDRHVICALCLGLEHAELALANGGCDLCEDMPLSTLRARLQAFNKASAPPLSSPRKKKRRSQRPPEPQPEAFIPPEPVASRSPSPPLPDIQLPPSGRSVASDDAADIKETCSLLASDSEEWSGSHASSARESTGTRAGIEEEFMRLLSQAVERLGLEWSPPPELTTNRMDGSSASVRLPPLSGPRPSCLNCTRNSRSPGTPRSPLELAPTLPPRFASWMGPQRRAISPFPL